MIGTRARLLGVIVVAIFSVSAASAQACSATWTGAAGDGLWWTAANWSPEAVPGNGNTPDVCLPDIGHSYTVTYVPTGGNGGVTVHSLTIGTASGSDTETLAIVGQSWVYQGGTHNGEGVGFESGATINATGTVRLEATEGGGRALGSDPLGGPAGFGHSPFGGPTDGTHGIENYGRIVAASSDYPRWNEELNGNVANKPGGSITVASGSLDQETSNTVVNHGTVTTEPGADYNVTSGGTIDDFVNDGSVVNNGTFEVQGGTGTFTQNGPVSGHPVTIESSSTLADESGAGAFTLEFYSPVLTGTVAAGQTVTVRGASDVSAGETQNGTNLSLGGGSVTNDGTLVLDATADGTKALAGDTVGGGVTAYDGSLTNNGALEFRLDDPAWPNTLNASVTNAHSGSVAVAGVLNQGQGVNGIAFTNDGTTTLAPSTLWGLSGGSSFANEADGTLVPQIAGASSFGSLLLGGTMTAAGALTPQLTGGYTPAAGQEFNIVALSGSGFAGTFTGTFGSVGGGFAADYTHETASPASVGVVYGGSAPAPITGGGGNGGSGTTTTTTPPPAAGSLTIGASAKVSRGGVAGIALSCAGATGAGCAGKLDLTVAVRTKVTRRVGGHTRRVFLLRNVRIGAAGYTLAAGRSETLSVRLSALGVRLLGAARGHKLSVRAVATPNGAAAATRAVLLSAAARR